MKRHTSICLAHVKRHVVIFSLRHNRTGCAQHPVAIQQHPYLYYPCLWVDRLRSVWNVSSPTAGGNADALEKFVLEVCGMDYDCEAHWQFLCVGSTCSCFLLLLAASSSSSELPALRVAARLCSIKLSSVLFERSPHNGSGQNSGNNDQPLKLCVAEPCVFAF